MNDNLPLQYIKDIFRITEGIKYKEKGYKSSKAKLKKMNLL